MASVMFTVLLIVTILLLWSFVRHLRRAQTNLGSARSVPGAPAAAGEVEGDSR
jgi:membrane protein implicated in regulation of membrane protease activity